MTNDLILNLFEQMLYFTYYLNTNWLGIKNEILHSMYFLFTYYLCSPNLHIRSFFKQEKVIKSNIASVWNTCNVCYYLVAGYSSNLLCVICSLFVQVKSSFKTGLQNQVYLWNLSVCSLCNSTYSSFTLNISIILDPGFSLFSCLVSCLVS